MGTLFVVGTPIGNLQDITLRALQTLKDVDTVAAEDTRHSKKLLAHFGIQKPLISFHKFSHDASTSYILSELAKGKTIAYVVDAGTPNVSDPGSFLVQKAIEAGVKVIPIPGVSAVTTLLSVAGILTDHFRFIGFFPRKKGRKTLLEEIKNSQEPVVFFESPYRIIKTLQDLQKIENAYVVIGRELTKTFETIYRGTIAEVLPQVSQQQKGEFTVIIQQ